MVRNRAQDGLRGPVKSCKEESTLPAVEGVRPEIRSESTTQYDLEGRIVEARMLQSDGSQYITRYEYGPSGLLLKIVSGIEGKTLTDTSYSYDQQGRIQKIAASGSSEKPISFHYDERGRKTETQISSAEDYRPNVATGGSPFEALSRAPNLPGGGTSTTIYDEHDRATEVQVRDVKGQLVSHAVRTYDAQGRISEEKQVQDNIAGMFPPDVQQELLEQSGLSAEQLQQQMQSSFMQLMGGQTAAYSITYRYDADGRLIHTSRRIFNHEDQIESAYNTHGDVESEITQGSQIVAEDESAPSLGLPSYSETRYAYQYDSEGNWTEKTASYRSAPDASFGSASTMKRTLTYY